MTSVLFADLVGFTPLSESRDAEDVRELLSRYFRECRTVIGRYGGEVEKFIGDAVMAVWGVPVSREDDAERAVRAALELVQATVAMGQELTTPGLAIRVGVVTGEVAVTLGATAEGMVAGDAVNTAARVQSAATPGQVWVDEATRSLTAAAIAYQDVGEHSLKGKSEPVRLWHARTVVGELGGGQRVDGLEAPLTGRDRELRLVKELFHSTQESLRPRLVVVDGAPGVGKSRLAWEFEKYADGLTATVRWHRGRCLSYGDGVAFWALAEALRTRLGLTDLNASDDGADSLEEALAEFVPDPEERDWLRPRMAALVGADTAGAFAKPDLFAAWTSFLERLSQGGNAVVLVIDDAQYADDGLLDFLDHMLTTARAPIFVIALARPDLLERRPQLGGRRTTVVRLDPLDDAAMTNLVKALVVGLPDDACAALVARAEGVPLFAVETVRALIDRDEVVPLGGEYTLAEGVALDLDEVGAPASLQALVAARLDALTPEERRIVSDASVLGLSFTREGLAALSPVSAEVDAALANLQRKEIFALQLDRFSAERGQFRFVQSVVRQIAYATLSRRDRRQRHLLAANHLSEQPDPSGDLAGVIAQHLLDAVDESREDDTDTDALLVRAVALLVRAAQRSRTLGSPGEAARHYLAALKRTDQSSERARLNLAAAEALSDSGDYESAAERAGTAMELFDSLDQRIDAGIAAGRMCEALSALGENDRIVEVGEARWKELDGVPGAEWAMLRLARPLANAHVAPHGEYPHGDLKTASEYLERQLLLAESVGDAEQLGRALIGVGTRYQAIGAPFAARGVTEMAADIARTHDLPAVLGNALVNVGTLEMSLDLPAALDTFKEALTVGRRSGVSGMVDYAYGNYASVLWNAGRLAEARSLLAEAQETVHIPTIRVLLAWVDACIADATGEPIPPLNGDEGSGGSWDRAALGCLEVLRLMSMGDTDGAAALAKPTLDHTLAAAGLGDDFMNFWPPLVRAAVAAEKADLAQELMRPALAAAPGILTPAVSAHLYNLKGLVGALRADESAQVEADFRAGVTALSDFGAVGFSAKAEEDLGRWLWSQGRPDEAIAALAHAADVYREIGASGWLADLDEHEANKATVAPAQGR
ncbi:MAG: adenylate/guanylate cyclase domain-containing protein [Actinomycetes bacterium]